MHNNAGPWQVSRLSSKTNEMVENVFGLAHALSSKGLRKPPLLLHCQVGEAVFVPQRPKAWGASMLGNSTSFTLAERCLKSETTRRDMAAAM